MKKVLLITSGILPLPAVNGGAVENLTENVLRYNEQVNNYKFVSYSIDSQNINKADLKKWNNTEFRYISKNNIIKKIFYKLRYKITNKKLPDYFISSIIKHLKKTKEQFDYILVENMPIYAWYLKKYYGGKIILHVHNDWLNKDVPYASEIVSSCKKIIVVSEFVKRKIKEVDKMANITVILNGIETERFKKITDEIVLNNVKKKYGISSKDLVFLYTGKLTPSKGALETIQAFCNTNKKYKNIKLLMVGSSFNKDDVDTPYVSSIKKLAKDNKNIIFTGFIDYNLIHEIYSIADVQIVSSLIEDSCPLVVIEGLSAGLAMITSISGGIPELVTDKCSLQILRDEYFVENISKSMETLINDKKLLQTMKKESFERSKKFTNKRFCEKMLKELDK